MGGEANTVKLLCFESGIKKDGQKTRRSGEFRKHWTAEMEWKGSGKNSGGGRDRLFEALVTSSEYIQITIQLINAMSPCWAAAIVAWLDCVCCRDFCFLSLGEEVCSDSATLQLGSVVRQHKPPEFLSCCSRPIPRPSSIANLHILNRYGAKPTLPTHSLYK